MLRSTWRRERTLSLSWRGRKGQETEEPSVLSPRATGLSFLLGPAQRIKSPFTYFPSCCSLEVQTPKCLCNPETSAQNNGLEQKAQSQLRSAQCSNCSFLLLTAMRLLPAFVRQGDVSQGQGTRCFYFRVPVFGTQSLEEARACSDLQTL